MEKMEVARLYELYSEDVYRLALSYLHNKQDAEAKENLIKILEAFDF